MKKIKIRYSPQGVKISIWGIGTKTYQQNLTKLIINAIDIPEHKYKQTLNSRDGEIWEAQSLE